jgi:hypothetical protein
MKTRRSKFSGAVDANTLCSTGRLRCPRRQAVAVACQDLAMRSTSPDRISRAVDAGAVGAVQDHVAIVLQLQLAIWSSAPVSSAVPNGLATLFVNNEVAVRLYFEPSAWVAVCACRSRMRHVQQRTRRELEGADPTTTWHDEQSCKAPGGSVS